MKLRHGDALVVRARAGRAQLDALRRLLGAGFQPHLLHNPLLHQAHARGRSMVLSIAAVLAACPEEEAECGVPPQTQLFKCACSMTAAEPGARLG